MGVYYIIVNDSKQEYVDPYCFDESMTLAGVMQGLHAQGIARLLVHPTAAEKYRDGYWSGDRIRVLGDNREQEFTEVESHYVDISFHVLANVFESDCSAREKIIDMASRQPEVLSGLIEANRSIVRTNLGYALRKLEGRKM